MLKAILNYLFNRRVKTSFDSKFVGVPAVILRACEAQITDLSQIPHFGVLRTPELFHHSRLDYLYLQSKIALEIKQKHLGLGLGSRLTKNKGLKYGNKFPTGLEIIQLWILAQNIGRLFGTYSTERALLFKLLDDEERRKEFVQAIPGRSREKAKNQIEGGYLFRFPMILGLYFLNGIQSELRELIAEAVNVYLSPHKSQTIKQLVSIYRTTRLVASLHLHALAGYDTPNSLLDLASIISDLYPADGIIYPEHSEIETPTKNVLKVLTDYHYRRYFTSPETAGQILQHLHEFSDWWEKKNSEKSELSKCLQILRKKPTDWPTKQKKAFSVFYTRVELPRTRKQWVRTVHEWRAANTWSPETDFLTSFRRGQQEISVDVYVSKNSPPSIDCSIFQQLSALCENSWQTKNKKNRLLWRSIASTLVLMFNRLLVDGSRMILRPVEVEGPSRYGFAACSTDPDMLAEKLRSISKHLRDPGRAIELNAAASSILKYITDHDPIVVAIGSCLIFEPENGSESAEIDVVMCQVTRLERRWWLGEVKSGKKGRGAKQMKNLMKRLAGYPYRDNAIPGMGVKGSLYSFTESQPVSNEEEVKDDGI